jgi:hypothetical protein
MKENKWVRLLAYITGLGNQELLLQNEYLAAQNRILRAHLRLSDPHRSTLAEIGRRLGRKALAKWLASPSRTRSWVGTGNSSPRSSMDPNTGAIRAGRPSRRNWRH